MEQRNVGRIITISRILQRLSKNVQKTYFEILISIGKDENRICGVLLSLIQRIQVLKKKVRPIVEILKTFSLRRVKKNKERNLFAVAAEKNAIIIKKINFTGCVTYSMVFTHVLKEHNELNKTMCLNPIGEIVVFLLFYSNIAIKIISMVDDTE